MTAPTALDALAGRVEAATEADRELDALIAALCRHALPKGGEWALKFPKWGAAPNNSGEVRIIGNVNGNGDYIAGTFRSPAYTASLDAAMTLVPEGLEGLLLSFKVEHFYLGNGIWQARASVWDGLGGVSSLDTASVAVTPALALCAAALRARARPQETTDVE